MGGKMKSIKVGGFLYKIDYPYIFKERTDLKAQADHASLTIRITPTDSGGMPYNKEKLAEAILHELIHCIDDVYNNNSLSENQVESLSNGLYQTLKDNPELNNVIINLERFTDPEVEKLLKGDFDKTLNCETNNGGVRFR